MKRSLLTFGLVAAGAAASWGQVISTYGDIDGFGFGAPEVDGGLYLSMGGAFWADYRSAWDMANAPFTDHWDAESTTGGPWTHTYAAGPYTSASLHLYIAGFADIGPVDLIGDGTVITTFNFPGQYQTTHVLDIPIPTSITNDGSVTFQLDGPDGDGYIWDYAKLTLIPEPAALVLVLAGGALLRRR